MTNKTSGKLPNPTDTANEHPEAIRLLRLPAVLAIIPLSRSAFLAGVKTGLYPRPVVIGRRAVAWKFLEIARLAANGVETPFTDEESATPKGRGKQ